MVGNPESVEGTVVAVAAAAVAAGTAVGWGSIDTSAAAAGDDRDVVVHAGTALIGCVATGAPFAGAVGVVAGAAADDLTVFGVGD